MNSLFVDDVIDRLSDETVNIDSGNQTEMREFIRDYSKDFPMVCYEHTDDSGFEVSFEDSTFLTDRPHEGLWIWGYDDYDLKYVVCLKERNRSLEIDAFEVNENMRGEGIGSNIISIIESIGEHYYDDIMVSPFDTNAINFWEHMDYGEGKNGYWVKTLWEI